MSRTLAIVAPSGEKPASLPRNGGFEPINWFTLDVGTDGPVAKQKAAAELARNAGAEWLIVLEQGESLAEGALELVEPALGLYDAIFGSAHVAGSSETVSRLTRLAFDEAERLPHALLNWWIPTSHLVRTEVTVRVLERLAARSDQTGWLDYLFELWSAARCLKSAQPMLELAAPPQPLEASGREDVLRRLTEKPVFLPVVHGDTAYYLPYTGRNAGIEREHSRGLFFEVIELEELRRIVKPGAHVVDVGANTGNHTIFFAGPMKSASVVAFEPLPAAAGALRHGVERNALTNVDLSFLGVGVSDKEGRATLVFSEGGGLGATSLLSDLNGEIRVATLDSMITGHVDLLKIDVEGMEMNVLAGAKQLIRRCSPLIFVEVANKNTPALSLWLKDNGYRVARIFTDKGHANYLLAPGAGG